MVVTQKKLVNAEHFLLDLSVMVKFMKVARLTKRKNAKHFMFAQLMELEVWPSTASLLKIVLLRMTCSTSTWTTLAASPSLSV